MSFFLRCDKFTRTKQNVNYLKYTPKSPDCFWRLNFWNVSCQKMSPFLCYLIRSLNKWLSKLVCANKCIYIISDKEKWVGVGVGVRVGVGGFPLGGGAHPPGSLKAGSHQTWTWAERSRSGTEIGISDTTHFFAELPRPRSKYPKIGYIHPKIAVS